MDLEGFWILDFFDKIWLIIRQLGNFILCTNFKNPLNKGKRKPKKIYNLKSQKERYKYSNLKKKIVSVCL